jgi:hypothetical protein
VPHTRSPTNSVRPSVARKPLNRNGPVNHAVRVGQPRSPRLRVGQPRTGTQSESVSHAVRVGKPHSPSRSATQSESVGLEVQVRVGQPQMQRARPAARGHQCGAVRAQIGAVRAQKVFVESMWTTMVSIPQVPSAVQTGRGSGDLDRPAGTSPPEQPHRPAASRPFSDASSRRPAAWSADQTFRVACLEVFNSRRWTFKPDRTIRAAAPRPHP